MVLRFLIFLINIQIIFSKEFVINSPVLTSVGVWHEWVNCPDNWYVNAMDLHSQITKIKESDKTGLISIVFQCIDLTDNLKQDFIYSTVKGITNEISTSFNQINNNDSYVVSYKLPLQSFCPGVAVGFQINSQDDQGSRDDTGMNNIRLLCSMLKGNDPHYTEGYGEYRGTWTAEQHCPSRHAICGLQTQSMEISNSTDNIAVENIRVRCCELPNPASKCVPEEIWETIGEWTNPPNTGSKPTTITYEKKIGIEVSVAKENEYNDFIFQETAGFGFDEILKPWYIISALRNNTVENSDNEVWNKTTEKTWAKSTTTELQLDVIANRRIIITQLVSKCSYFLTRSGRFKAIEYDFTNGDKKDEKEFGI